MINHAKDLEKNMANKYHVKVNNLHILLLKND